jgi:hypothetical protein
MRHTMNHAQGGAADDLRRRIAEGRKLREAKTVELERELGVETVHSIKENTNMLIYDDVFIHSQMKLGSIWSSKDGGGEI